MSTVANVREWLQELGDGAEIAEEGEGYLVFDIVTDAHWVTIAAFDADPQNAFGHLSCLSQCNCLDVVGQSLARHIWDRIIAEIVSHEMICDPMVCDHQLSKGTNWENLVQT